MEENQFVTEQSVDGMPLAIGAYFRYSFSKQHANAGCALHIIRVFNLVLAGFGRGRLKQKHQQTA